MYYRLIFALLLALFCCPEAARGESYPNAVLLPWEIQVSDREVRSIGQNIQVPLFKNAAVLSDRLPRNKYSENLIQQAKRFKVLDLKTTDGPVLVTPILCSLEDSYLVSILVSDAEENHIRSLGQVRILKTQKSGWEPLMMKAYGEAFTPPVLDLSSNLKLILSSNHLCKDLLLTKTLLGQGFRILNSINLEQSLVLKHFFKSEKKALRSTRQLRLQWENKDSLIFSLSESVFSKTIVSNQKTSGPAYKELFDVLSNEKKSLLYTDNPLSVKVYGAWVYLDKGRAWGLQISDRLSTKDKTVRGQIVRYFGPEEKLNSPRGFAIHEGAILYVRKGQEIVKEGLELNYDVD